MTLIYLLIKLSMKTGNQIIPSVISSTNNDVSCYRGITDIIILDFFNYFYSIGNFIDNY